MFPGDLQEGYFFCTRGSKYLSGVRARRATRCGYWKSTGKDKAVHGRDGRLVGRRKTLCPQLRRDPTRRDAARRAGGTARAARRAAALREAAGGGVRDWARLVFFILFFILLYA